MNEIQIGTAVVGLTQVIKMSGLPSKYLPAVAVVLGVALTLIIGGPSIISGMTGLVIGLSATGLVNRADHYINGKKKRKTPKPVKETIEEEAPPVSESAELAPEKEKSAEESEEVVPPTPDPE